MNPIAFHIGSWPVYWYGILISGAMIIGIFLIAYLCKREGLNPDIILGITLIAIPLGIIGARLYYVFMQWFYYSDHIYEIPMIWKKGLAIHGGIIGGLIGVILSSRAYNQNFWRVVDVFAPALVLGQAIGRWGNYFNQEAYGYVTDVPWAMMIQGQLRHPTFLYESIWDLLIFVFLLTWMLRAGKRQPGQIFLSYLGLYSLGRLFIEGLRTDSLMFMGLRAAQCLSIVLIIASILSLYYRSKKYDINGIPHNKKKDNMKGKARKS